MATRLYNFHEDWTSPSTGRFYAKGQPARVADETIQGELAATSLIIQEVL